MSTSKANSLLSSNFCKVISKSSSFKLSLASAKIILANSIFFSKESSTPCSSSTSPLPTTTLSTFSMLSSTAKILASKRATSASNPSPPSSSAFIITPNACPLTSSKILMALTILSFTWGDNSSFWATSLKALANSSVLSSITFAASVAFPSPFLSKESNLVLTLAISL